MKYYHILRESMTWDEAAAIFHRYHADPRSANLRQERKRLIKQNHPDNGGDHVRMAEINAAFDVLKIPRQPEAAQDMDRPICPICKHPLRVNCYGGELELPDDSTTECPGWKLRTTDEDVYKSSSQ